MPLKEDQKGPLNIDNIPNPNAFTHSFEGEDDKTTDDEIIIKKKDLYNKF